MAIIDDFDYEYSSLINSDENIDNSQNTANESFSETFEPKDRLRFVEMSFGFIGLSQLIPWNFLITANDYWMYKFRDINQTNNMNSCLLICEKTTLQTYFDSYLSIASNLPFLVILLLNAFLGHKVKERIGNFVSFATIITIFIITTIFIKINTDNHQQTFFGLTIVSVILLSISAAFLQSSVSGVASVFPNQCMHAMVTGQAVSGLFAALAQILSLTGQWNTIESALYYFLLADITLIIAFIMYFMINKTDYYKFHKQKLNQSRRQLDSFPVNFDQRSYLTDILSSTWPYAISVMMAFWVTLALYPSVTVLVVPQNPYTSQWTGKYFLPITCFLLFNLSDFLGRFAGRFCPISLKNKYLLLFISFSRISLIALIMLCNATPRSHLPVVFKSEVYYILFITLLGFSNGYVIINAMISGSTSVSNDMKERVGFLLVAFLGLGLTLGSFSSNILLRIL